MLNPDGIDTHWDDYGHNADNDGLNLDKDYLGGRTLHFAHLVQDVQIVWRVHGHSEQKAIVESGKEVAGEGDDAVVPDHSSQDHLHEEGD